jgi:hypothetical protein
MPDDNNVVGEAERGGEAGTEVRLFVTDDHAERDGGHRLRI